jgi:hypothetical protein
MGSPASAESFAQCLWYRVEEFREWVAHGLDFVGRSGQTLEERGGGGEREREREKQGEAGRVGVREREINRKLRPVPAEKTDFDLNCVSV